VLVEHRDRHVRVAEPEGLEAARAAVTGALLEPAKIDP
jgi:hypothetical protein